MMQGLDVEPNPLDRDFLYSEPRVIFSDDDIVVASKPSGMLSVPGKSGRGSMMDWLAEQFGPIFSCHRLDMDTSGIMVFARTLEAKADLDRQFASGEVQKTYRARLEAGRVPFRHKSKGTIALPLAADYYDRPRQIVDRAHGKQAITEYEVRSIFPDSEVDIVFRPHTGRDTSAPRTCGTSVRTALPHHRRRRYGRNEIDRTFSGAVHQTQMTIIYLASFSIRERTLALFSSISAASVVTSPYFPCFL